MQVGQVVNSGLHLEGIILMNVGAHGYSSMKNSGQKNGVGWSQRLKMAEVVPKVVTRKKVGG